MMKDNAVPFNIVDRAKKLVDQYLAKTQDEQDNKYDVTLFIMATGSILSYLDTLGQLPMDLPNIPSSITSGGKSNHKEICKHLRNAIAHSHINVLGKEDGPIEKINLKDYNDGDKTKPCNYDLEISVRDFKAFFDALYSYANKVIKT